MSEIQRLEEATYDRHSEYYAVMQAEAHDPYLFAFECETHGTEFIAPDTCPECPAPDPNRAPDIAWSVDHDPDAEDPLF